MAASRTRWQPASVAALAWIGIVAGAFLAGAVPFGVLIARRRGVDIRARGSGNIGATNVARVLGPRAGAAVLVLDALKGALPTAGAVAMARAGADPSGWGPAVTALAAIAGHCFSPFLGGRGGKGVATALGVFLVLAPAHAGIGAIVFGAALAATRVPAIGSLCGAIAIAALGLARGPLPLAALGGATTALLLYTHRTNLAQLRRRGRR
jgi:glycerol-3-phosphate acyltransferase PlsY